MMNQKYMETYSSLTGDLFGEPLTLSQADSLASRSVQPESERAEPMNDISFRKCFELFQRSDRVGSSLKTFAACLVSNLDQYSPKLSHRWKAKATRSLRFVFLLQPSKPRTGEIDCGLLLTPTAADYREGIDREVEAWNEAGKSGVRPATKEQRLRAQIPYLLNTPNVMDSLPVRSPEAMKRQMENNRPGRTQPPPLREQIGMLPTPHGFSQDGKSNGPNGNELGFAVNQAYRAMVATPRSSDYKGASAQTVAKGRNPVTNSCMDAVENSPDGTRTGLKLQPAFVEWMMGYPIGYTDLKPSETA
jgi:hypothetical protein